MEIKRQSLCLRPALTRNTANDIHWAISKGLTGMGKVLKKTLTIVSCSFSVVFLSSIASPANTSARDFPFITIDKGLSSGVRERKFLVVKTEQEWSDLWQVHASKVIPPKERPSADFNTEMVVAVFLGEQRSGGSNIEITRIEEDMGKRQLSVFWRENKAPTGSMVIQALTQPYHIVKLGKLELPVVFLSKG